MAGPEVLALFGPTDPRVWAPLGPHVRTLRAPCHQAPEVEDGTISGPETCALNALSPETVLAAAAQLLAVHVRLEADRLRIWTPNVVWVISGWAG